MPAKRRTNAEIREVAAIHDRTDDIARAISKRINDSTDETAPYISISASAYLRARADYQRDVADELVVSFSSKDPDEIERVALAIRAALAQRKP